MAIRQRKVDGVKMSIGGAQVRPASDWDGPTWESSVVSGQLSSEKLQDRLNVLGAQGWEPFAATTIGAGMTQVFMRRRTK